MYYGKKTHTNSDYYNAYNNNSYQSTDETSYLTLILKSLIIIFLLGVLFIGYLFISDRAKTIDKSVAIEKIIPLEKKLETKISKDILIEKNKKAKLNQEEIAMIVQAVMNSMNKMQSNSSSTDEMADDDAYTKRLLSGDVDALDNPNKREIAKNALSLKDSNHYNKVIINRPKNETYSNDTLSQLSSEMSILIDDSSQEDSSYTQEITKEIAVRSNEMRFIIVEGGDTLSKIAYRAYGNYDAYEKIFAANPEVIQNPNQIYAGQKLRIPL